MTLCGSWMNVDPFRNEGVIVKEISWLMKILESSVAVEAKSRRNDSEYEQY